MFWKQNMSLQLTVLYPEVVIRPHLFAVGQEFKRAHGYLVRNKCLSTAAETDEVDD